jgi:hypothetical protein
MDTISESTFTKNKSLEITTTSIYKIEGDTKSLIKKIELHHWTDKNYLQTHIYDEWGYKILWFDNHGVYQHFDRKVKTEGKPSEIGKMEGDSWYITNTKDNIFEGKQYHSKDFKLMRERFFCEPHPQFVKENL